MRTFRIHTQEHVHGTYHVRAEDADEARSIFEAEPWSVGEQQVYEAYDVEVESVEEIE